jgi:hypothetical protein
VKQERDAARSACKVAEARLAGVDLGAIDRDTADMRLLDRKLAEVQAAHNKVRCRLTQVHPRFTPGSPQVHPRFTPGSPQVHPRFTPGSPQVDCAWCQHWKLKFYGPFTNFAINFNLCRHKQETAELRRKILWFTENQELANERYGLVHTACHIRGCQSTQFTQYTWLQDDCR